MGWRATHSPVARFRSTVVEATRQSNRMADVKVLLCGAVLGRFDQLFKRVATVTASPHPGPVAVRSAVVRRPTGCRAAACTTAASGGASHIRTPYVGSRQSGARVALAATAA